MEEPSFFYFQQEIKNSYHNNTVYFKRTEKVFFLINIFNIVQANTKYLNKYYFLIKS